MCNFFSAIADKHGNVYFCEDNSHDVIIKRAHKKDNGDIVRLECTNGRSVNIDQGAMPDWYERISIKIEQRVLWLYKRAAPASKAYDEAHDTARQAYDEAYAPASKAYDEACAACDTASKAYDEAHDTARQAYDEAHDTARQAYDEACAARAIISKAYGEACATARQAYDEAHDTASKAYIPRLGRYKGYVGPKGA